MNRPAFTLMFVIKSDCFRQFGAWFQMVAASHHQIMAGQIEGFKIIGFLIKPALAFFKGTKRPIGNVAIAFVEMSQQNATSIRGFPIKKGWCSFGDTAPKTGGIHVEAVENLG